MKVYQFFDFMTQYFHVKFKQTKFANLRVTDYKFIIIISIIILF